eukprot:2618839-Pyramimonas_sp.AAC.1
MGWDGREQEQELVRGPRSVQRPGVPKKGRRMARTHAGTATGTVRGTSLGGHQPFYADDAAADDDDDDSADAADDA